MKIEAIKTEIITPSSISLEAFLDKYITELHEEVIVVFSSKVISLIEGRVSRELEKREELVRKEADFISREETKNAHHIIIKEHAFIFGAGIDLSNAAGTLVLLPENAMQTAREIQQYLANKFKLKQFGVIISDSRSLPLRRGTVGVALGFSGFSPLLDYRGTPDIFGRNFEVEVSNIVDSIAIAANLAMGEGTEQTPIAVVSAVPSVKWDDSFPTEEQLNELFLDLEEDLFYPFYKNIF